MTTAKFPKKKTDKFKKRYVLATGYPWALGIREPYKTILMTKSQVGVSPIELDWPEELWANTVPEYRLILERVK